MITGPTTGYLQMTVKELRVDDQSKEKVEKGETFSIVVDEKIRPSDKLYKLVNAN
jgi:putative protease